MVSSGPRLPRTLRDQLRPTVSFSKRRQRHGPPPSQDKSRFARGEDPPRKRVKTSKAKINKIEEDDNEIATLERKLGLKSRKLPKSFDEEGLGELLGNLDKVNDLVEDITPKSERRVNERWLETKKRKDSSSILEVEGSKQDTSEFEHEHEVSDAQNEEPTSEDELNEQEVLNEITDASNSDDDSNRRGSERTIERPRKRENPFVPPVPTGPQDFNKYIPPARRTSAPSDIEAQARLRRQIQGSLNKLSESNLISIVNEVEKLYPTNPRQYVHEAIIGRVMALLCDNTALNMNFLSLHAAFTASLYRIIGTDFGVQCIEQIVQLMSNNLPTYEDTLNSGKQALNLVTFLAHLYNFGVVGGTLMFDYIRDFLEKMTETHTELLLRVIRSCGHQLRQDHSGALKEIANALPKKIADVGEANVSVRTKFMVEEITKLKDGRVKHTNSSFSDVAELVTRYRKILGSLSNRTLRANQPLSVSLRDLRSSDKKGKWWLVGASWNGPEHNSSNDLSSKPDQSGQSREDGDTLDVDFDTLARQHHMNTSVRRAIFITLVSASDYTDAHHKLLKLNLTRSQERQIPHVLLHCVSSEPRFNRYYLLVAQKFCANQKLRMTFQFALWDVLKRLTGDADATDAYGNVEKLHLSAIVNYGKFFGSLIASRSLPVTALKPVKFQRLEGQERNFVEMLLIVTIAKIELKGETNTREEALRSTFIKAKEVEGLATALRWFLKHTLATTDLVSSEGERKRVQAGCKIITPVLRSE